MKVVSGNNLFDLNDIKDLPPGLLKKLSQARKPRETCKDKILDLFNNKKPLNILEISVGFYRKHKAEISVAYIKTLLRELELSGIVGRLGVGIYELRK